MDKVIIRDLTIEAIVGLYPWERIAKQTLLLNIDMSTDIRQAAQNDDLRYTVDYSAVCDAICQLACDGRFKLIETLAEKIAALVLGQFSVTHVTVSICKTDVMTHVGRVGIEISRGMNQ